MMKTNVLLAGALLSCLPAVSKGETSLSEPSTVFYGKVLNQSGVLEHVISEGELEWKVKGTEDDEPISLRSALAEYAGGEYSYRLDVPHHVLALGLESADKSVPIGAGDSSHRHLAIQVNGRPAVIRVPGNHEFQISSARRAATHRLDLLVAMPPLDSDGDGMPDWWEDEHGLDKQNSDADGDADGDGISNLNEYLRGTGASHDNRGPELLTSEVFVYSGAATGLPLRTFDVDSAPEEVVFTLTQAPGAGVLVMRNVVADPADPHRALETGDRFTQADVNAGRIIFLIGDESADPAETTFAISVRDEDPDHQTADGEIEVRIFVPKENALTEELIAEAVDVPPLPNVDPGERTRLRNAALGREHGFVVWDLSGQAAPFEVAQPSTEVAPSSYLADYVEKYGEEVPHVVVGGRGSDVLAGGMRDDHLTGGAGDDSLSGGGGRDRFIVDDPADGHDTLEDFQTGPAGDLLDVSGLLDGASPLLKDYLQFEDTSEGARLGIDADGDGSGFEDVTVTFAGAPLSAFDLHQLVEDGNLAGGAKLLEPRVEIAATVAEARENGPTPGAFTIRRAGSAATAITVNLLVSGTASNGTDYSRIPAAVTIPADASSIDLPVNPFSDTHYEVPEVVEISLTGGTGYVVGRNDTAQLVILDLRPEISITALTPVAETAGGSEGRFMISRSEVLDRNTLVRLQAAGTARPGADYETLPTFVEFDAGQSFRIVSVKPLPSASLEGGPETVVLSVVDDSSYLSVAPAHARVHLLEKSIELADWKDRHFPDNAQDLEEFALSDSGAQGIAHLFRYGFGLHPTLPTADHGARPAVFWSEDRLGLRFQQNPAARDLRYEVEISENLRDWRPAEPSELEDATPASAPAGVRVFRSSRTMPAFRFMRVRLTRVAP